MTKITDNAFKQLVCLNNAISNIGTFVAAMSFFVVIYYAWNITNYCIPCISGTSISLCAFFGLFTSIFFGVGGGSIVAVVIVLLLPQRIEKVKGKWVIKK